MPLLALHAALHALDGQCALYRALPPSRTLGLLAAKTRPLRDAMLPTAQACPASRRSSVYLPMSSYISLYLPVSPFISPVSALCLPTAQACIRAIEGQLPGPAAPAAP